MTSVNRQVRVRVASSEGCPGRGKVGKDEGTQVKTLSPSASKDNVVLGPGDLNPILLGVFGSYITRGGANLPPPPKNG